MDFGTAYGHWGLVIVSSVVLLTFTFSFFRPKSRRDWRTFGMFSAFVFALFIEMYGFPLTIFLLYGWLSRNFPDIAWFSHDASHLLQSLLGWETNAHLGPLHIASNILIVGGLILLGAAWRVLYSAQRGAMLASTGPYAVIRHPQYASFVMIMIGFLIQWPTLPTLIMFPVLLFAYYRLAIKEEKESRIRFGKMYACYAEFTPRFLPRFKNKASSIDRCNNKGENHDHYSTQSFNSTG